MGTIELTADTFEQTIADNDIVLVDWWASWCGPCRMFAPVFEEASKRHEGIVFAKIDTEANPQFSAASGIMSIPTLMVFREQVLVYSQPGAVPPRMLEELIGRVRDLDMGEVHRLVAERAAATS